MFIKTKLLLLWLAAIFTITGCGTDQFDSDFPEPISKQLSQPSKEIQSEPTPLMEGDTVSISFPGSSTLDTTAQIRMDGKIAMPLIGEVTAAGKTPEELQNELVKLYQPQLATKQIIVSVKSPSISVYVVGAVMRPGSVTVDHPLSALDAVMEAGGFDYSKANLKNVIVVRQEKDRTVRYELNLKKALAGSQGAPFYLQPYDIVYIPERFTWY